MKKSTTVTLVSAVIITAIMVMLWTGFDKDNEHLPVGKNDLSSTEPETAVDTDEDEVDEESQPASSAKRIVRVPGKNPEAQHLENEIDNEVRQSTKKMLDSAMAGNTEDTINISQLLKQCSNRLDEGVLRNQLNRLKNQDFSSSITHSVNGVSGSFASFEEMESALWHSFDQCRAIKGLFDDDLREQLKDMAKRGSVVARYLYATWPPKYSDQTSAEHTLALLEYQNLSNEFTWQNLDEGEPLGVLAFGKSFGGGSPFLFTAQNYMQHHNFIMAAKKCGLSSPWLDTQVDQIREHWDGIFGAGSINPVEESSDEIKELFCD